MCERKYSMTRGGGGQQEYVNGFGGRERERERDGYRECVYVMNPTLHITHNSVSLFSFSPSTPITACPRRESIEFYDYA
jgi:hypothetical protein